MTEGISFGKNKSIDFSGYNGVSGKMNNTDNEKQKKLGTAIFKKYDSNENGILEKSELTYLISDIKSAASGGNANSLGKYEAQNYLTNTLGLSEGEFSRDDLFEILNFINEDIDDVDNTEVDENKNVIVSYKPDEDGNYTQDVFNGKTRIKSIMYENGSDNHVITTKYANDGVTRTTVTDQIKGENPIVTVYKSDGTTVKQKYREVSPTVKEYLDAQGRVSERYTNKGSIEEITVFEYLDDGTVVEKTYTGDVQGDIQKSKTIKSGGSVVSKTDYTKEGDNTVELHTEGDVKTKSVLDKDNNRISCIEVDEDGNAKPYEHTVDKDNDTWYGIVQAKYGITDHKTTMEIVHQLKDAAGVDYKSKVMPDTITLPPTITLKSGDVVELKDIKATVDERHNVPKHISTPVASSIPEADTVQSDKKEVDMSQYTTPENQIDVPDDAKSIDVNKIMQKYPIDKSNAGKLIEMNGEYVKYDTEGYPALVYDTDPKGDYYNTPAKIDLLFDSDDNKLLALYVDGSINGQRVSYSYNNKGELNEITKTLKNNGSSTYIRYNPDGSMYEFSTELYDGKGNTIGRLSNDIVDSKPTLNTYEFDDDGNTTAKYKYGSDGKLESYIKYYFDTNGNTTKEVEYDNKGNVIGFIEYKYRSDGKTASIIYYDANGDVTDTTIYKYHKDDDFSVYSYNSKGDLIS